MKIIDWLLDTAEKRRTMVYAAVMALCAMELLGEIRLAVAILKCGNTADVIAMTSVTSLRSSFLGRVFFNSVQYAATDEFLWYLLTRSIKTGNILTVLLFYICIDGMHDERRTDLFVMLVMFMLKAGLFAFAAIRVFQSTDTAIGLQRLHTAAGILSAISVITLLFLLIRLFTAFYRVWLDDSQKDGG